MESKIAEFQIREKLYESDKSLIFCGIREHDNLPVILKILRQDYPSPAELIRYRQEYDIIGNLKISGVIKTYGFLKYQNTIAIILEDFGGKSLRQLLAERSFVMSEWLSLAIRIAGIMGELHATNIIHKDINPGNIVFNHETDELKIIDFGIASILPRENPTLQNPEQLEGTLAYISPEQTGRMNRSLDYRTDIYSLGVTLYELLTRRLPFKSDDAMELVHCHLARKPVLPHELDPNIPVIISDIIMKLMAKTAEERYQSAWGLQSDLKKCQIQLASIGAIRSFVLGQNDISSKFQIHQKLYGREAEIAQLLSAFERISSETGEMLLVSGYSGIGKTALIREIYRPVTERRGYFVSGKFDPFRRDIPYSAIVNAFKDMIKQLLSEKETRLAQWKTKLQKSVGNNGQLIVKIIPELGLIIGKQPEVPVLPPAESQNRFNIVFRNFFRALCDKDHPLVLFTDDLQWADFASLNLLKVLMTDPENRYFLIIGAYRDNEVNPAHPLILTIEDIRKAEGVVHHLQLQNLCFEDVDALISDTLLNKETQALTRPVYEKTLGNPFFTKELLKSLHDEGLLFFDVGTRT